MEKIEARTLGVVRLRETELSRKLLAGVLMATIAAADPLGAAIQLPPAPEPTPVVTHSEEVVVGRVLVNTHVLGRDGNPVPNLGLDDFRVEIDGKPARLESAEWVEEATGSGSTTVLSAAGEVGAPEPGRLIVLLFQWEVASQKQIGFVRMQRQASSFVRGIHPGDRVAVLLFDSRLWLVQDFTSDRDALAAAVESVLARRTRPGDGLEPSLADGLVDGGKNATGIEKALLAIASALKPIRGAKSLVFFGWGIGVWEQTFPNQMSGHVRNRREYGPARRALNASETAVFCLDISDGGHSLAEGLDRVAYDTGGFYLPTYLFPEFAIDRLRKALRGYYALVVVKPQDVRGRHSIRVRVGTGRAWPLVLHRSGYDDEEDAAEK